MISARVDSCIRLLIADLSEKQVTGIIEGCRAPNPAAARAQSPFSRVPQWIEAHAIEGGFLILPRGAAAVLRREVPGVRFIDARLESPRAWKFRGDLRPYQEAAVVALLRHEQGIAVVPCGGGKTRAGLAAAARTGQTVLVIAGAVDLVDQWAEEARALLGVEPAIFGAGSREIGPITVGTVQTLAKLPPNELAALANRFGCVVLDEVHHAAADTWRAVVSAFPARFRFGLTATPNRADGLGAFVELHVGAVRYRVTSDELIAAGHSLAPRLRTVSTAFSFAYSGPDDWPALLVALVADRTRNALIADTVAAECGGGVVGLVLTGRVEHAAHLADLVNARGLRAAAVTGSTPKRERARLLDAARAGDLDVLVSTQLADEGLNIERLSRVFLTFPSKSEARLVQRIGRILRPHPDKGEPAVFDFTDMKCGVLANQARKRARTFHETWGQMATRSAAA